MKTLLKKALGTRRGLLPIAAAVILPALVSSCAIPDQCYYPEGRSNIIRDRRIDKPKESRNPAATLAVVEYDENGRPWLDSQQRAVLAEIDAKKPRTILLYAHGWHNDASPDSEKEGGDLNDIDHLVHQMVDVGAGPTLAIYTGWRGESTRGLARWVTLDDRRETARHIGRSAHYQEFLAQVASSGRRNGANVIFVGHSLGGALMEKAAHGLICSKRPSSDLPHMFLLLNIAETSEISSDYLGEIDRGWRASKLADGVRVASPLVVSITSEADSANRKLLPLNGLIRGRRSDKTIGFDSRRLTHRVTATDEIAANSPMEADRLFRRSLQPAYDPTFWGVESGTRLRQYRLSANGRANTAGVWNFQIPGSFVADHNDVYNGSILAVSASMFQLANPARSGFPDNLPEMLAELKELRKIPNSAKSTSQLWKQRELLNGAALRIPRNHESIGILLSELEGLATSQYETEAWAHEFRQDLFRILKFAYNREDGWSDRDIDRLRRLVSIRFVAHELNISGLDNDKEGTKDWVLDQFREFVQKETGVNVRKS